MANTLKIKRGTNATTPQGQLAEPLFTTDTYDLYIGKGGALGNQRFQKYIASGTSSQFLKGDGTLDSTTYQPTSEKGQNNGYASLDAGGKVPVAQLPNSIMEYLGTWDASTNTPTLANGTGNAGDVYICSVGGTVNFGAGPITFAAGDWVVYSGSVWQKSINSNAVASVNGQTGAVVLYTDDISEDGSPVNLWFTNARARTAISLTTTGTSGAATYDNSTGIINIPQYQGVLTNPVTGTGTNNEIAYFNTTGSTIASLSTATYPSLTELSYVKGVTSAIQTQLNAKEPTVTKGNLTETTSSVLTITGGTGAVIGSGTTIAVASAGAAQAGVVTTGSQTFAGAKTFNAGVTFVSTDPFSFISNSNTGTFDRSVIYANQNNTSADNANGIFIERGRLTDSGSAEIRQFVIGSRGGQIQWRLDKDGNSFQTGSVNGTSASFTASVTTPAGFYVDANTYLYEGILRLTDLVGKKNILQLQASSSGHYITSLFLSGGSQQAIYISAKSTSGQNVIFNTDGSTTFSHALSGTSATFSGFVGVNGSPATAFPLEAYINSATAYTTSSRGNVLRVYNTNTGANIFAGIELGGAGSANDGLAGINATVTGNGSAALTFYTRDANTFSEKFRIASTGAATFSSSVTAINAVLSGTGSTFGDGLRINRNSNTNQYTVINHVGGATNIISVDQSGNNIPEIYFQRSINGTSVSDSMMINKDGKVGIGTTSPNRLLEVATSGDTYLRVTGNRGNADDLHVGNVEFYNSNTTRIIAEVRAITGTGGTQSNSGQLAFYTNNAGTYAERMRITSGGNVGIGVTSPSAKLEVSGAVMISGADAVAIANRGALDFSSGNTRLLSFGANTSTKGGFDFLTLTSNGTGGSAMTITSGGAVQATNNLTANSPSAGNTGEGIIAGTSFKIDAGGTGQKAKMYVVSKDLSDTYGSGLQIQFANQADTLGFGFNLTTAGTYETYIKDSSANWQRRMSISNAGNVSIGTTGATRRLQVVGSTVGNTLLHNQNNASGDRTLIMQLGGSNTDNTSSYYIFCDTDAVGVKMVVYGNGNVANVNNSYGAYSDVKLKENIVDATPKLQDLLKVKIRNFNLKGTDKKHIGVIAQELEQIFPALIEESDDTIKDENGEQIKTGEKTKSVKYSVFVPMLIKAIQEQQAQIEELKSKLA